MSTPMATKHTSTSFLRSPLIITALFLAFIPVAVHFLFIRLFTSGTNLLIDAQCLPSLTPGTSAPFQLEYTGIAPLDQALCGFIGFFHASFGPEEQHAFSLLLINVCTLVFVIFVEGSRNNPHKALSFPGVWGMVVQIITMAMTMPIYWLTFLLQGGNGTASATAHSFISQERAEAVVFGFVAGCVVPSFGLVIFKDPQVTAIWQIFPVYVSASIALHHFLRPTKPDSQHGHRMIQMAYIAIFMFTSSYHVALVWPILGNWKAMQDLLLPVFRDSHFPEGASLAFRTLDFFKWDAFISVASSLLASLWSGSTSGEVLALALWAIDGPVLVGPAATICAVMCWREIRFERLQSTAKKTS